MRGGGISVHRLGKKRVSTTRLANDGVQIVFVVVLGCLEVLYRGQLLDVVPEMRRGFRYGCHVLHAVGFFSSGHDERGKRYNKNSLFDGRVGSVEWCVWWVKRQTVLLVPLL